MNNDLIVFAELKQSIAKFVAPTKEVKVKDFQSAQQASDAAKAIIAFKKDVEKKRKELVEPLNIRVKSINFYAKEIAEPLERAEACLRQQLIIFETEQEKIREAERKRVEAERLAKEQEEAEKAAAALAELEAVSATDDDVSAFVGVDEEQQAAVEAEKETLVAQLETEAKVRDAEHKQKMWEIDQQKVKNSRKTWNCELVNIDLVPKEYLKRELNKQTVLAAARGGITEIPGVRLFQEIGIAIGAKTYVPRAALEG